MNKLVITTIKHDKDDDSVVRVRWASGSDESWLSEQDQTCCDVIG
jgi:hypothetical protein